MLLGLCYNFIFHTGARNDNQLFEGKECRKFDVPGQNEQYDSFSIYTYGISMYGRNTLRPCHHVNNAGITRKY